MARQLAEKGRHDYDYSDCSLATRALHVDRYLEPGTGVAPGIMKSVTHMSLDDADFAVKATEPHNDQFYPRHGNPTAARSATIVADLEGKKAGRTFASGMAAISTTLFARRRKGDH